jgi:hypothetical protein
MQAALTTAPPKRTRGIYPPHLSVPTHGGSAGRGIEADYAARLHGTWPSFTAPHCQYSTLRRLLLRRLNRVHRLLQRPAQLHDRALYRRHAIVPRL